MNWYTKKLADFPIADFKAVNDINSLRSSFQEPDKKILNSPKAIENIKRRWEKVGPWINVYFYSNSDGTLTAGDTLEKLKDPNKIGLVITNSQNHPTTPWMIAHRLSHALGERSHQQRISSSKFNDILIELGSFYVNTKQRIPYDAYILERVLKNILTMKSARESLPTISEMYHELFTQYLMTGKITLNPLPKQIVGMHGQILADRKPEINSNYKIQIEKELADLFQQEIDNSKGKVLID